MLKLSLVHRVNNLGGPQAKVGEIVYFGHLKTETYSPSQRLTGQQEGVKERNPIN